MLAVIGAILAIGLLIVVHEAGHFVVARRCKMRVDRFSIGFGPPILKWRRGETDFTIGPIPFGGFVQIHGMTLADEVAPDDTRSYPNRPVWQRFLTIFAGPATNYLFAIVLALILFSVAGLSTAWYTVEDVTPGYDAQGKLQPGDTILAVDGQPIYARYRNHDGEGLSDRVNLTKDRPLRITVERAGKKVDVLVTPKWAPDAKNLQGKKGMWLLGIRPGEIEKRTSAGFGDVVVESVRYPIDKTILIATGLWEIVTGKQKPQLTSVVGITGMIKKAIDVGWVRLFELLMMLNVYLGLFNLLPLPALDGGRLVFLGYEMATRRRANPRVEATVHMVGIMALLLLMVLVTYQDITRLF